MFGLTPFNRGSLERRDKNGFVDFSDMVNSFFTEPFWPKRDFKLDTFKLDIKEEEDAYVIEAELPGVQKEEVSLDYDKGILTISVTRLKEDKEEEEHYLHRERSLSTMKRRLQLGPLYEEQIEASLQDGLLKIKAKKRPEDTDKRKIEIK